MNHSHNESKVKQAAVNGGTAHWNPVRNISKIYFAKITTPIMKGG